MNPFRNNVGTLNEILFENRNQNYGAYVIRKAYSNTVFKSLAITATIIILGFWGLSLLVNTKVEIPNDTGANTPPDVTTIVNMTKPKIKIEIAKPISQPVSKPLILAAIGTKIIDSAKTIVTPLNTNIESIGTNSLNISTPIPGTGTLTNVEPTNTLSISGTGSAIEIGPDVPPSMPGWSKILRENLVYPYEARENRISGKVVVNFIVDETGAIIQTKIIHKVGFGCDEEALRVIKLMPKWKPGMLRGKPVKVSFNQIITFQM